ncbi:16709_t:CDS:2 [Cetraspora pellucida]|uniref:16709_t:CDS:1 n=1 Tax=Cetraspora pellucida TaxID=1433469 RepID=A0A9N8YWC0_9GLOM|nr:16709_t:CDS:2 [Cetraspora pellucida]
MKKKEIGLLRIPNPIFLPSPKIKKTRYTFPHQPSRRVRVDGYRNVARQIRFFTRDCNPERFYLYKK